MNSRGIKLHEVSFGYHRSTPVLHDLDLEIGPGLTLLLGPNGGGKSTLLKVAAGVEQPDDGRVQVNGHDLWRDEAEARRDLAYLPEEPDLTPYASVLEVLCLVCRLRGEADARAVEALSAAGLQGLGHRSVRQLSKGQRRRALVAAAWIGNPRTLLLDEPLDAMDQNMRQRLLTWLEEIRTDGGLALVVSHEVGPLAHLADGAIAVKNGRAYRFDTLPSETTERLEFLQALARGEIHPAREEA